MTGSRGAAKRQVVPRWRPWRTTALLGEAARPLELEHRSSLATPTNKLLADYEEDPHRGRGGDLLSVASVYGDKQPAVLEMATRIAKEEQGSMLGELAQSLLETERDRHNRAFDVEPIDSRTRVARLKRVLMREPHNSLRWTDLAREYLSLGQTSQAERAILVALQLNPDDRFILRSAVTLYAHGGRFDKASAVLEASGRREVDPWLLAPAIAILDLSNSRQGLKRAAVRALEGDFPEFALAELAAAVGTVEMNGGSERRGRQLLRRSARDPTENALAQVEWVSSRSDARIIGHVPANVPRAFEALTHRADSEGRWRDGLGTARHWQQDQTFSAEAAIAGSFCACELEDWVSASAIASSGLLANPDNISLLNNMAYAEIEAGRLPNALTVLERARSVVGAREDKVVLAATEALLLYRAGMAEEGKRRYDAVVNHFSRKQDVDRAAKASLMCAREEIRRRSDEWRESWHKADLLKEKATRPDVLDLGKKVARLAEAGSNGVVVDPRNATLVRPILQTPPELES